MRRLVTRSLWPNLPQRQPMSRVEQRGGGLVVVCRRLCGWTAILQSSGQAAAVRCRCAACASCSRERQAAAVAKRDRDRGVNARRVWLPVAAEMPCCARVSLSCRCSGVGDRGRDSAPLQEGRGSGSKAEQTWIRSKGRGKVGPFGGAHRWARRRRVARCREGSVQAEHDADGFGGSDQRGFAPGPRFRGDSWWAGSKSRTGLASRSSPCRSVSRRGWRPVLTARCCTPVQCRGDLQAGDGLVTSGDVTAARR